jgi:REP element-mobilizing transposase RayT
LLRLHPTTSVPRVVQRLKGGSSVLATRDGHCSGEKALRWEKGYNIQSVSETALKRVAQYVEAQPSRHPGEAIAEWHPTRFGSEVASATVAEWRLQPPN